MNEEAYHSTNQTYTHSLIKVNFNIALAKTNQRAGL